MNLIETNRLRKLAGIPVMEKNDMKLNEVVGDVSYMALTSHSQEVLAHSQDLEAVKAASDENFTNMGDDAEEVILITFVNGTSTKAVAIDDGADLGYDELVGKPIAYFV